MTTRRRQDERSQATRDALLATARRFFAERGYNGVAASEIVAAAGVTRGALYHHYLNKQALFEAVFEQLEAEITGRVGAAVADEPVTWAGIMGGLAAYLDACTRPDVVQIALTDAPTVLGWVRWREVETRHGLGLLTMMLQRAMAEGLIRSVPAAALAQLLLGAAIEAALLIAHAPDPLAARADVEQTLLALISGLQPANSPVS